MKITIISAMVAATAFVQSDANAQPDAATNAKAQVCEACHGPNGNSTDPQ